MELHVFWFFLNSKSDFLYYLFNNIITCGPIYLVSTALNLLSVGYNLIYHSISSSWKKENKTKRKTKKDYTGFCWLTRHQISCFIFFIILLLIFNEFNIKSQIPFFGWRKTNCHQICISIWTLLLLDKQNNYCLVKEKDEKNTACFQCNACKTKSWYSDLGHEQPF